MISGTIEMASWSLSEFLPPAWAESALPPPPPSNKAAIVLAISEELIVVVPLKVPG